VIALEMKKKEIFQKKNWKKKLLEKDMEQ